MVVSEDNDYQKFTLEELGVDELEWESMSKEEQEEKIQDAINELPSQPYWMVDEFNEL